MTDLPATDPPRRGRRKHAGRHIKLPNGDTLVPRRELAEDELGITEKSLKRRNPPTVYLGGVAYVPHDATLQQVITDRIRRRTEPRRRG